MKYLHTPLLAVLLLTVVFVSSCTNDEEVVETTLSADDARQAVSEMAGRSHNDLVEMLDADGMSALTDLVDLMSELEEPFGGRIKDTEVNRFSGFKVQAQRFQQIFVPSRSVSFSAEDTKDERFVFETSLGVYNWDGQLKDFVKTTAKVDFIEINFPTNGSTTNNATLTLLAFEDAVIEAETDTGLEQEYVPTLMIGNLKVDDVLLVSLDYTVSFQADGEPKDADISMFIMPFDYHVILKNTDKLSSSFGASITRDSQLIMGTDLYVKYESGLKEQVALLRGDVKYREYKLSGTMNVTGINRVEETGSGDINDFVDLFLYKGNSKIGEVIFQKQMSVNAFDEDYILLIRYADGSEELFEDAMTDVLDEVEGFVKEIEGES